MTTTFKCPKCGGNRIPSRSKYMHKDGKVLTRRRMCKDCGHRVSIREVMLDGRSTIHHMDIEKALKSIRMRLDTIEFERRKILKVMEQLTAVWNK